jgi:hypothetical protein
MSKANVVGGSVVVLNKREVAKTLVNIQRGRIFTAYFVSKVDGTSRRVNGRMGVTKYLKGENNVNNAAGHPDLLTTFAMGDKLAYRNIVLDSITEIRAGGNRYKFEG